MTQTNQEKLDEMYEIVQENNELLSSLLRREKIAIFFKVVYWVIILGGIFGAYYYAQPYLQTVTNNVGIAQQALQKLEALSSGIPEVSNLRSVFNSINSVKAN